MLTAAGSSGVVLRKERNCSFQAYRFLFSVLCRLRECCFTVFSA